MEGGRSLEEEERTKEGGMEESRGGIGNEGGEGGEIQG